MHWPCDPVEFRDEAIVWDYGFVFFKNLLVDILLRRANRDVLQRSARFDECVFQKKASRSWASVSSQPLLDSQSQVSPVPPIFQPWVRRKGRIARYQSAKFSRKNSQGPTA